MASAALDDAMEAAVKTVLAHPVAHARLIRVGQALLAVSAIEDPNPLRAVGQLLGTAIEFASQVGLSKKFVLDFTAKMYDTLHNADGDALRAAANKQKG